MRPGAFTVKAARKRRLQISLPPRVLWPLGIIALCVALGDESIADWGGLYLKDELQTTAAVAALSYTIYSLTMLIGRLSGDLLVRRLGPVRVIAADGAISVIGLIIGLLTGTNRVRSGGIGALRDPADHLPGGRLDAGDIARQGGGLDGNNRVSRLSGRTTDHRHRGRCGVPAGCVTPGRCGDDHADTAFPIHRTPGSA